MSSTSLLEAHLRTTQSTLVSSRNSSGGGAKAKKEKVAKSEGVAKNYVTKAKKALAEKERKVKHYSDLIVLSQPKKKSRKILAALVKEQQRGKGGKK